MPLLPAELLHKRYRIVSLLAAGPYGATYRAYDQTDRRDVAIKEYLDPSVEIQRRFRAEARRLCDWFLLKMENEVTRHLVRERVFKLLMTPEEGGGAPDSASIRAARANIRQHMKYTNWLAGTRHWLAGPRITYADLAAASTLSLVRASRATRSPRWARPAAMQRPRPVDAPTTTTFFM